MNNEVEESLWLDFQRKSSKLSNTSSEKGIYMLMRTSSLCRSHLHQVNTAGMYERATISSQWDVTKANQCLQANHVMPSLMGFACLGLHFHCNSSSLHHKQSSLNYFFKRDFVNSEFFTHLPFNFSCCCIKYILLH